MLLFFWQALFVCHIHLIWEEAAIFNFELTFMMISPFIGWLADVKLGRYRVIVFASLVSFISSIVYFGVGYLSMSNNLIADITYAVDNICYACFLTTMLPFVTDQLIGASSAELSTVVQWFYFFQCIGAFFAYVIIMALWLLWLEVKVTGIRYSIIGNSASLFSCAVCLALIIISDCLCQQWLDRTHKVTNPIKLIIQVLNYTRKHRYPERRSAFTYLDEEQPSRIDFGKEKFGGPFTEEEVEDVKTILRLVPIVCCISFFANMSWNRTSIDLQNSLINVFVNMTISNWFFPIFLVPLYQLVILPFFHNWIPSILKQIGITITLETLGIILLTATEIKRLANVPGGLEGYVNCTKNPNLSNGIIVGEGWYWSIIPKVFYCSGTAMASLLLEFIIAQAPHKMKGFVIGMSLTLSGFNSVTHLSLDTYFGTLCYRLPLIILPVALYILFLFLAKRYTLRERNREINIQAIVEEHYERYLDQEEEYMRQRHF